MLLGKENADDKRKMWMLSVLLQHVSNGSPTGQDTEFFSGESAPADEALSRCDSRFDPYPHHQVPVHFKLGRVPLKYREEIRSQIIFPTFFCVLPQITCTCHGGSYKRITAKQLSTNDECVIFPNK